MRLYYCHFPDGYLRQVYYNGWPETEVRLYRSPPYEMLNVDQRVAFFDVMVALIRKVVAGQVKTAYMHKDFPNNPALKYGNQVLSYNRIVRTN